MNLAVDAQVRRGAFALAAQFETPLDGIIALFGPSGAGKSMLLAAIAGLAKLDRIHVAVGDERVSDVPPHLRRFGLLFQDARLFPHLSVRGNLTYAATRARSEAQIDAVADQVGCAALLDRPVRNLSGGERGRVALARALLSSPRLLLLDEPFAALDGATRMAFLDLLRDVQTRQNLPMIVVTHQIDDLAILADHVVALQNGAVVASGPVATVTATPAFRTLLGARDTGAVIAAQSLRGVEARGGAVWVRADHVLIASQQPTGLSARNVWEGQVSAVEHERTGAVLVQVQTQAGPVLARVTQEAATELGLDIGATVWAVVKAHSI